MSNLVTKIEEAIAMIDPLYRAFLEGENDVSLNKTEFEKLDKLAEEIFHLAYRENLDRYLPQKKIFGKTLSMHHLTSSLKRC